MKTRRTIWPDDDHIVREKNQSLHSYDKASSQFKIPKTTIFNKVRGQFKKDGSKKELMCMTGPGTALTKEMEKELETSLEMRCRLGFPINVESLRIELVEALKLAKLPNVFEKSPNGLPSPSYITKLVKRMTSLSIKHAQPHANGRAAVSCEALLLWYTRLKKELVDRRIFDQFMDPKSVFNMDESAFFINDLKGKYICKRGETTQLRMVGSEKDNYTVGVTFSANGDLLPPFIVFKLHRPDKTVEELKKPGKTSGQATRILVG
ncbi:Hypothetical predicted protein [Cloeon dipterum]|uniref:HTH psq-type domain-containing protein n=1 Tax=Cloeon dipterum TaxID=197152 RepID=A0A8S1E5S5_9INSE|nr:Hypothetical predicted protein [Cloeon dipterum]